MKTKPNNELTDGIFKRLFEIAEIAKMDKKDFSVYQESLKDYWDLKSAMDTYFEEGEQSATIKIALNLLDLGLDITKIAISTGLSVEEIEKLKKII